MDSFAKCYAFSCCYTGSDDDSNADDSDLDYTLLQILASGQSILMIYAHCCKIQRFVFADFQGDEVMDVAIDLTAEKPRAWF